MLTVKQATQQALVQFNVIAFATIIYLYFLDLSFIKAVLRASLQSNFYASDRTITAPVIVGTVILFLYCVFSHLISGCPEPSHFDQGYNHGGIYIDFVGQGMSS